MSEFTINKDMFGQYVRIQTGYSRESHIYKVLSRFQSNAYCDVPIVESSVSISHVNIEHVLNVVHCGIDESKVICVALKDCEIVEIPTGISEELRQYRALGTIEECKIALEKQVPKIPVLEGDGYADDELVCDTWICPCCNTRYEIDYDEYDYCPECGQHIKRYWSEEE